jgi:hypothetical protein
MRSDYKINEILKLEYLNSEMLNCLEIHKLNILFLKIKQLLKKTMVIHTLLTSVFENYHSQFFKIQNRKEIYNH